MKKQTEKVKWFLDFMNADLSHIRLGDKMKLVTDTLTILTGQASYLFEGTVHPVPWTGQPLERLSRDWMEGDQLARCQKKLREFFDAMMKNIDQARRGAQQPWKPVPEFNSHFFLGEVQSTITVQLDTFVQSEVKREGDDLFQRCAPGALENTPVTLTFKATTDEETLLFYFIQALDGFPVGALRQCLECDRWFVHVSKKIKIYCSNRCAARRATRARRARLKDENPQAYKKELQANKERALKSYDKKLPSGAKRIPHKKQ